jgi:diguanylate cyclase
MDAHLRQFRLRESERAEAYRERAERMRSRVEQLEGETRQLQASLVREQINATTDPLTGVPNRLAYEQRVALEFKRWKRFGRPLCLVAWDIDHFKRINDGHGHQAGDAVIRSVARLLAQRIRETDFLARYGGEEFVMLLVDTAPEAAMAVLDKLRRTIAEQLVRVDGGAVKVTASAGLAEFRGQEDPDAVFARADRALYRAKQTGRNRCERG